MPPRPSSRMIRNSPRLAGGSVAGPVAWWMNSMPARQASSCAASSGWVCQAAGDRGPDPPGDRPCSGPGCSPAPRQSWALAPPPTRRGRWSEARLRSRRARPSAVISLTGFTVAVKRHPPIDHRAGNGVDVTRNLGGLSARLHSQASDGPQPSHSRARSHGIDGAGQRPFKLVK